MAGQPETSQGLLLKYHPLLPWSVERYALPIYLHLVALVMY